VAFSSEQSLLCIALRHPVCVDEALSLGIKKDHFDHPHYRIIWEQFVSDRGAGVGPDRSILFERFTDRIGEGRAFNTYEDLARVVDSIERVPAIKTNIEAYVGSIIESARRKFIVRLCHSVIASDADQEPFSELMKLTSSISNVTTWAPEGRSEPRLGHEIARDYLDDLEAQRLGLKSSTLIQSGISDLDNILYVRPGQMIVVGGRPKMGKTHLMITMLRNVARIHDQPTLFVSAEMNEMQVGERIATSERNLGMTAEDVSSIKEEIVSEWADIPIYFDDKPKSLGAALMSIRTQKKKLNICAAAVDYLQLLKLPQSSTRERQVAEASSAFKRLSMELDIPIFVVAQLNRSCEFRENKRPILSDLRDSGQIEQDADAVVFVYRHSVYDTDYPGTDEAEVIVRAQRNGPTGTAFCQWQPGRGWFRGTDV
jgi:replicative DNA helicase